MTQPEDRGMSCGIMMQFNSNMRIGDHTENGNKRKQGYQNDNYMVIYWQADEKEIVNK